MRYDNIKIGPCWTTNIKIEPNQGKGSIEARSSFTSNRSVLTLLVSELNVMHSGYKHRIIGSRHNHKYDVKGLLPGTNVSIDTGIEDDPVWTRTLESIEDDIVVETTGYYTFTGVEVKFVEPDTGTLIVGFETVEVESTGVVVSMQPNV